jgi:hypothetical protein
MAVTITPVRRQRQGNIRTVLVDITGPASYTANGEVLTAAQVAALFPEVYSNLTALPANANQILQFDAETPATGHALCLDRTNWKMRYFNGTTEIAGAVNLSAVTIRVGITYQQGTA